jgi:hypothetical protein
MANLELQTIERINRNLLSDLLLTSVAMVNALNATRNAIDIGSNVFHEAELLELSRAISEVKVAIDKATKKLTDNRNRIH